MSMYTWMLMVAAMSVSSCYASSARRDAYDVSGDTPSDDVSAEADQPQQPYSMDFVIKNGSPEICSSCVLYLDHTCCSGLPLP